MESTYQGTRKAHRRLAGLAGLEFFSLEMLKEDSTMRHRQPGGAAEKIPCM